MKNMDLEQIRALAQIMKENGLSSVKVKDADDEICLKMGFAPSEGVLGAEKAAMPKESEPKSEAAPKESEGTPVKSPMVGVFYSSPSPEENPYVRKGDRVKKGDVLCIIEAMKLMNEITAEADGEIVSVCAEDGNLVEYGQTLFIIR